MWLGCIPIDRAQSNNLVADSSSAITRATGPLQLIVPPEGTRRRARCSKTGLYYIAADADAPIVLA